MSKSIMATLAAAITASGVRYDADADLPLPNIYLASVYPFNKPAISVYVAADHTRPAVQKVSNMVAASHYFRPMRSNSVIKMRRLRLGDVIENPDAYTRALLSAKAAGETDIVAALRKLPQWVSELTGTPIPPMDSGSLWGALTDALSSLPVLTRSA